MTKEYQSPQSQLDQVVSEYSKPFFITSTKKMVILYLATLGMYSIYWCYKQWKIIKFHERTNISPALRSVFLIFFIFQIFKRISEYLSRENIGEWDYRPSSYLFLVFYLFTLFGDRIIVQFAPELIGDFVVFFASMLSLIPLYTVQRHANLACGDPSGESNSEFSVSNIVFVILGVVLWLLILLGLAAPFIEIPAN